MAKAFQRRRRNRAPLPNWTPERIRALRIYLGLTQQMLAEDLAVRQATVCEWESGKHKPRRMTLRMLTDLARRAHFNTGETNV